MHTNHVHAIFWQPTGTTMAAGYQSTVDQYLSDVAADSGKLSNVYATDTQYYDTSGTIQYSASFGPATDAVVDTDRLPASGCSDNGLPCLTDAQLQIEIDAVIRARGWPRGTGNVYLLLTPKNVGSCFDSGSTECAFASGGYCAYHNAFGSGSNLTVYANMPYVGTDLGGCGTGQSPNANTDADAEINVLSHEHNESITDPDTQGGWFDSNGYENGDKCAWDFGTTLGSTGSGSYNQQLNGHDYYLQLEWSNAITGCAQTMASPPTARLSADPTTALVGQAVALNASLSTPAPGTSINGYTWSFGDGTGTSGGAVQSHSYSTAGTKTVTVTVIDADGGSSTRPQVVTVTSPAPAPTPPGASSGTAASSGSGATSGSSSSGSGTSGTGPSAPPGAPTPPGDPSGSPPSSKPATTAAASCPKGGPARKRCQARHSYKRAVARCARRSRNKRASCRRAAKRAYQAKLTAIRCASAHTSAARRGCPRAKTSHGRRPSGRHVTMLGH